MRQYIALIHKEADSDYGVSFPDLPGVISAGSALDEARDMATEALALHLEGLAEDGEAAPEPSSLEAIMGDADNKDGVAVLIPAPAALPKSVRINVTIPADVLDQIDRYAEREDFTRDFLRYPQKKPWLQKPYPHPTCSRPRSRKCCSPPTGAAAISSLN